MISLLIAATVSMGVSLVGTNFLIGWLTAHQVGQPIREEGPEGHHTKAGTPTMGGIAIVVGALVGYVVSHVRGETIFTWGGLLAMFTIGGAAVVGMIDDWLKVSRARNLGLNKRAKIIGLLVIAVLFTWGALELVGVDRVISFTRYDVPGIEINSTVWAAMSLLFILGFANAVNLTDGLDGLAAGSAGMGFLSFMFIGFWAFRHPEVYDVPQALDLAIVAAAMAGGCIGFLWWNAAPAQVFMGDTGSLAIGAGLASLSLLTNTELLLPIIGGLYVVETLSVIVQVATFRAFGTRVLRMAPIHHHFELGGWPETTVIIRLWILSGLGTALALGLFYADFISTGALD